MVRRDAALANWATVAGPLLHPLGRLPEAPGDLVELDGWSATVLE